MLLTKLTVAFAIFLIASSEFPVIDGGRVLIFFPLSSKSMTNLFEPLTKGLIAKGHQVTIVTPVKFKIESNNLTQIQPITVEDVYKDYFDFFERRRQEKIFRFDTAHQAKYCHQLFEREDIRNLEHEKFDVIIYNMIHHDCFAGLFHKIGSPLISFASCPAPSAFTEILGNPSPSSFLPNIVMKDVSDQSSFSFRVKNFLFNAYFHVMLEHWTRKPLEAVYREHLGQDLPSIVEIFKEKTSLVLMNSHFAVTNARPLLPSIVEIGGIHCKPSNPLAKDFEDFVGDAKNGFILFSMGSIVKATQMPDSVQQAFVKAFGKLKQKVIWKWDGEPMRGLSNNVKLVKWAPQQDLLGHPNIRLFITHGGLLSTEEAVWHGVPVLGMPIFVDQDGNMKQAENLGFGVKGEVLDLTEAALTSNIKKILDNPNYMKRAKEVSKIFQDQSETPLERAVYWTEYVMRHNGAYHLRSAAMNLNSIQYYSLDVVSFLIAVTFGLLFFIYYLIKLIIRLLSKIFLNSSSIKQRKMSKRKKL